jgi:hypothetical protein
VSDARAVLGAKEVAVQTSTLLSLSTRPER